MKRSALTLYTFKFESDIIIDESIVRIKPDGVKAAYVKSTFQEFYHPNYEHLRKVEKVKTNNKGRKKIKRPPKTKKKNNGDCDSFSSSLSVGVIHPEGVYGIKIFRKKSGNIPSLPYNDIEMAKEIINIAFDFISENLNCNLVLKDVVLKLRNLDLHYKLDKNELINVYLFKKHCRLPGKTYNMINIQGESKRMYMLFDNTRPHMLCIVYKRSGNIDRFYQAKIYPEGRIYIFGGLDEEVSRQMGNEIIRMLDENRDLVVQSSEYNLKVQ